MSFLLFQAFPIQWGICAPKQCDEHDLTNLVDKFLACKLAIVYVKTFISLACLSGETLKMQSFFFFAGTSLEVPRS